MGPVVQCRYFSGYKPCQKNADCNPSCPSKDIPTSNILIVHLGAQGAVVRSTALLKAIKRKHPSSRVIWITESPMDQLLRGHPMIDQVLSTSPSELLSLQGFEFDFGYVIDKSKLASGIVHSLKVDHVFGFISDTRSGGILPANSEALELWKLGLSDQKKFFENQKPETQLIHEALALGAWTRDEYWLELTAQERREAQLRKLSWSQGSQGTVSGAQSAVIGLNTGCGPLMPAKKLTIEYHRSLIQKLLSLGLSNIVLLGGPEDAERNHKISQGLPIFQSSLSAGVRDGLTSIAACDLVVTGDSFGMHMAVALKKYVVAWFGPSCIQEIDLYDRGVKIKTQAGCSPCWKKDCQKASMCYDQVDLQQLIQAIQAGVQVCQNPSYLSKPHSLGI